MNIWSKSPEWNFPSSKDASRPVPGGRGLMELGSLRLNTLSGQESSH